MKKKRNRLLAAMLVMSLLSTVQVRAQYKWGFSDASVALSNVKHGLPFMMIMPIHPGFEVGATFLKNDKPRSFHSIDATAGFYHHRLISNGSYLHVRYNYQIQVKQVIGVDLHTGLGYVYAVYPGDAYGFNSSTQEYEKTRTSKSFLAVNAGFGLSYIKPRKLHPFLHYDFNGLNLWAYDSFVNSTVLLKAGLKYNF